MRSGCIKASLASQLVETVAYVLTDIPLLKERALEMITKCGTTDAQNRPSGSEKNKIVFEMIPTFYFKMLSLVLSEIVFIL